ncbi:aminotransferase class V-fold PLP-dependent enzyme [Roseinatronobacter sp. S2]|uniref:aminotransferase class V-fold PLP-dependent enzyme n=1 Tax=Roseinatronobacter sp. S2 TaxID=3035471 RepID=UPI00240FC7EC|nr:aminotransferase class V-fold PLP-dependent enzyme [Roseinatronobacter sp. S2]WFE74791.1 aminotransferase class V-fold PLP-dependent enzyme [Roseinatronobacter sp. S2]
MTAAENPLDRFARRFDRPDLVGWLRRGLIGDGMPVPGPFGTNPLLYADYVASGRALEQVEQFVMTEVLPWYANSHTEASFCGSTMTRMRRAARGIIARMTGADDNHAVIFAGAGATAGINRLVHLFGVPDILARNGRAVVFVGPYEHHSNILPWRESGADVIEIPEAAGGGPDLDALARALAETRGADLRIGAFSAASNVTGVITDVDAVTRLLNAHDVLSMWDYAGAGPYLPIDMKAGTDCAIDAVVISPHKFIGGPGASGVLIVRKDAVSRSRPVHPGGGTVRFVSPWGHVYAQGLVEREEAGTPNVVGDIRAAMVFIVKNAIGQQVMDTRHADFAARAQQAWAKNPRLELLGIDKGPRLPIFAFRVRDARGGHVHHQLFTRMLSDCYGIQARGGCACAGPYAHRLLNIDAAQSDTMRDAILSGDEMAKPGWVRLNFSVLLDDAKADLIIRAVDELARNPHPMADAYAADFATARFAPTDSTSGARTAVA